MKRFLQLQSHFLCRYKESFPKNYIPSDHLHLYSLRDLDEFFQLLNYKLKRLLQEKPIRLVIIDSIAVLFQNFKFPTELSETLFSIAGNLKSIAAEFQLVIICVNHVSAYISPALPSSVIPHWEDYLDKGCLPFARFGHRSEHGPDVPAMGLSWSYCVTARLLLTRTDPQRRHVKRMLHILFSSSSFNRNIELSIGPAGVTALGDNIEAVPLDNL